VKAKSGSANTAQTIQATKRQGDEHEMRIHGTNKEVLELHELSRKLLNKVENCTRADSSMLMAMQIQNTYLAQPFKLPILWNISRKHFRVQTTDGRFIILNKFENHLTQRDFIRSLYSSKTRKVQMDLLLEELKPNSWRMKGFIPAELLGLDVFVWTHVLTSVKYEVCQKYWDSLHCSD